LAQAALAQHVAPPRHLKHAAAYCCIAVFDATVSPGLPLVAVACSYTKFCRIIGF